MAGLDSGFMFKPRFWKYYGCIAIFFGAYYVGVKVQRKIDDSMSSYKHKSMLFKDVKIPPGEDFWRR